MKNKRIVIAGGTGFIGQALAAWFGRDNEVIILTRSGKGSPNNNYNRKLITASDGFHIQYCYWDGLRVEKEWAQTLDGCDLVINLAGRSVNCRYTPRNKREILESRIDSTRAIGLAIRDAVMPPKLWINGASATIYRHAEDRPQDELTGEFHNDFSVQVCKCWEKTFDDQRAPFTRKVALRMAVTLGAGGVVIPYLNLLKFALGGRQGNGQQMYSWVHVDDLCRTVEWIDENEDLEGVYNVSAPNPVTNSQFMASLRKATGHRIGLPAYAWMLRIGARLIGTEPELLLKSRWVLPQKLLASGFRFRYTQPEDAFRDIVSKFPRRKYHLF